MGHSIAIIGAGHWGKNLIRNFARLGCLRVVCDDSQQALDPIQSQYPNVETVTSAGTVFSRDDIDAVVVATPPTTHYELAKSALKAKKHVFVEKPLALDVSHGEMLANLAVEQDKILMVGHLLHYHAAVIKLKELVYNGELGKINYIYSNRLSFGKIRHQENTLWSFAPHDISDILGILNDTPSQVSCQGSNCVQPHVADVSLSQLQFSSGKGAHIFVSWMHPFKEHKLVIVGDKQMAVCDDTLSWDQKLTLYPHEIHWKDQIPVAQKAQGQPVPLNESEPLLAECRHFLESIESGNKPITDSQEGLQGLKVLNALQQSMEQNGQYVAVEAQSKPYFAHETAFIDEGASIGDDCKIWHFSHVMGQARLGKQCNLGQNVVVMPNVVLGNNVKVQNNISIYEGVEIEDDVFLGPSMVFTNINNPRSHISRRHMYQTTKVRQGATIGANATVICGNEIGRYAFVGAGSVVTKDVPAHALVYGNPARQVGWMCHCGFKLKESEQTNLKYQCEYCGSIYFFHKTDSVFIETNPNIEIDYIKD